MKHLQSSKLARQLQRLQLDQGVVLRPHAFACGSVMVCAGLAILWGVHCQALVLYYLALQVAIIIERVLTRIPYQCAGPNQDCRANLSSDRQPGTCPLRLCSVDSR